MPEKLRKAFERELKMARFYYLDDRMELAWDSLGRAHILSQGYARAHLRVHWHMLVLAWRTSNRYEVLGQILRLVLAVPGSLLKKAPKGNPGFSYVGLFKTMKIPKDLAQILEKP